jgi:hypothetical protein
MRNASYSDDELIARLAWRCRWRARLYKHIQAQGFTVADVTKYV